MKVGVLIEQFKELDAIGGQKVREVLSESKTSFNIEGKDFTPAQLLERLGFAKEHLSARVKELSAIRLSPLSFVQLRIAGACRRTGRCWRASRIAVVTRSRR